MPKVGNEIYDYTEQGMKDAQKQSSLTGQPVENIKDYSESSMYTDARDRKKIMPINNSAYDKA